MKPIDDRNLKPLEDNNIEISPQQRLDINRLASVYDDAVKSKQFTPQELSEIERSIREDQQNTSRSASLRAPEPTMESRFRSNTYIDQKTGQIFPIQKDGTFGRPISTPPETGMSWQDYDSLVQRATTTDAQGRSSVDMNKLRELYSEKSKLEAMARGENIPMDNTNTTTTMPQPKQSAMPTKTIIPTSEMNKQLQVQGGNMANPKNKAEYDALPSGTFFVDPNGITRRKA
jgi:hypothetical protein